jgi:glycine cleavage system aminomethyltransferase T
MREGMALGNEPILSGNECVGYVTSSNYGYSIGKHIAYGYLPIEFAEKGTQLQIEYLGERFTAVVDDDPLYDAKMSKLKS